jgi:DNA-binding CsgD family transcriptional regulator
MRDDWIHILETAYALGGDDAQWLKAVAEATRPGFDLGLGVVAYFFDASTPRLKVTDYCGAGADESVIELARRTHQLPAWQSSELIRATYHRASSLNDSNPSLGPKRAQEFFRSCGYPDDGGPIRRIMILHAADPSHLGCVFGAADPGAPSNLLRRKAPWSRAAAHISAGLRLRRRLATFENATQAEEAVLSPSGDLLHAEGPAKDRSARDALRKETIAIDKARGRLRRTDPDAALALWRGLLDGRWSLIDRFDSDGRRFVVAHRNHVETQGLRALTLRERQVASYAALAHPNKLIAYELGLSVGSVSVHLTSALAKLGAKSRVELVEVASSLGRRKVGSKTDE